MSILRKPNMRAIVERAIQALDDDELLGICINCGAEHDGHIEPDARKVMCQHCGEREVYGAEEIIIIGAS